MIITNSNVTASAKSSYEKITAQSVKFTSHNDVNSSQSFLLQKENCDSLEMNFTQTESGERANAQDEKNTLLPEQSGLKSKYLHRAGDINFSPATPANLKEMLIGRMIEALTGKPLKLEKVNTASNISLSRSSQSVQMGIFNVGVSNPRNGFSITTETATMEKESVSYSAVGEVKTADGKIISFDLNLSMSRSTESYMQSTIGFKPEVFQTNRLVDPLVINYAGTAASLTNEKFDFDLDSDGKTDRISFAGSGNGFLALDKNGDGKINDGSELFGPQSGNGFDELRKYDEDGNGWIDEADSVYEKLQVWTKDNNGNDILYKLKDLDIGAIYLNDTKTQYGMYDASGNQQGMMQSSSIFLKDSGGAGTISHIDLLV